MLDITQIDRQGLDSLNADQLRGLVGQLLDRSGRDAHEIVWRDAKIDKLTFEVAQLKRLQYGKKSEQLDTEQRALFDEAVQTDIAAVEEQIAALQASLPPRTEDQKQTRKRAALPARLPRVERCHEPDNTTCACGCAMKRVGEDVSEKLDYTPGVFTVERHVRGKWACAQCKTPGAGPRARGRDRQGHPHRRPAGPGVGGQAC